MNKPSISPTNKFFSILSSVYIYISESDLFGTAAGGCNYRAAIRAIRDAVIRFDFVHHYLSRHVTLLSVIYLLSNSFRDIFEKQEAINERANRGCNDENETINHDFG